MENKNKFLITEIIKGIGRESILADYIPEEKDPKHDDLPSEILEVGKSYYVTFTPVNPDQEQEFNKAE